MRDQSIPTGYRPLSYGQLGRLKMRSSAVRPGRLDDQKKGGLSESALSK